MTPRSTLALADAPFAANAGAATSTDLWRRDAFLAPIEPLLTTIKVLSLDVFDTLLFRTCRQPEDIFLEVGKRARAAGLLASAFTPGEFASLRHRAQQRTYATLGREPRLEDIYALLPTSIGALPAILDLEIETEADFCTINPSIASLIERCNECGIHVVLVSDMYLGERRVRSLLTRAGFDLDDKVRLVLVSVDTGTYKMTGASYRGLLHRLPDVEPHEILHIGDNVRSDVIAAREAGLKAVHYDIVRHDPGGTLALERVVAGNLFPELDSTRRLAGSLGAALRLDDQPWFRTGATVVGPLVASLVHWTLDQCEASGVTLVAPLMREGHVLAPLVARAAAARGLTLAVQPLYVSRHSVALAGIRDVRSEFIPRVVDARRHFTIGDLFALIGTDMPAELAGYRDVQTSGAGTTSLRPGHSLRTALIEHLLSPAVEPSLQRLIDAERGRLVDYLDSVFGRHRSVATLDIGFFGQIQRAISTALAKEEHPASVTHLLGFGHGPVQDDVLGGLDVRTFAGGYGSDGDLVQTIHRSAPVLEQLLQGPEGTTTGYLSSGGRAVPLREKNPLPANDIAAKSVVQDGITAFHELWLGLARTKPALVAELVSRRHEWCALAHRLIAVPARTEAERLGSLHDDVNFGSSAVLPFCPESLVLDLTVNGTDAAIRRGLAALPAVWPQGTISRANPDALLRTAAEASRTPFTGPAFALAGHLVRCGITRLVGYGTGDAAVAFADAAAVLGIEIMAFVDSDATRHGLHMAGVAVTSLDAAVQLNVPVFAVLSLAHAQPIADTIRRRYVSEPHVPLIFDLVSPTPIKVKHP